MMVSQKLALRASEIRTRLSELAGTETLEDGTKTELDNLRNEYADVERKIQAALISEDKPVETRNENPEDRELDGLLKRGNVGNIFEAALEHRSTEGPEKELQDHFSVGSNSIPLQMLRENLETRTTGVTPGPANVGQMQSEIVPGVFPQSCAAYLAVDMPVVPTGDAVYPVLTTNATAHAPVEGADAAHTTGSFSAEVLTPARIQASFFYSREDRARFAGMSEALRSNLSEALSDQLDAQILAGPNGLLGGSNLPQVAATARTTFALYRAGMVYDRIDGTYASMATDMRTVVGAETYADMATVYRANNADDSALDSVMRVSSGCKVSAHIPAVASDKQEAIVRRGLRRDAVSPIWEGVTLIPDEITQAQQGEIKVTAVLLYAVKILRADGFAKVEVQHA